MERDPTEMRERWMAWAMRTMGGEVAAAEAAAKAAMNAEKLGASSAVATVLGRMTKLPPTEADIAMLHQELARIRHARLDLVRYRPQTSGSEPEIERLRAYYTRLDGLLSAALTEARRPPELRPHPAWVFVAFHAVVAVGLLAAAAGLVLMSAGPGAVLGVACLALAYVLYFQRPAMAWLPAVCFSLAVLDVNRAFGWGQAGVALELLALATVYLAAGQVDTWARRVLDPCVAVHLLLCALITSDASRVQATVLVGAVGVAVFCAVQASRPVWLALAAALGCAAAYWIVKATLMPGLAGPEAALGSALVPMPVALGAVAIGLRMTAGRRWARPVAAVAMAAALAVAGSALLSGRFASAAAALGGYGLFMYGVALLERSTPLALAGLAGLAAAPLGLLGALPSAGVWLVVGWTALALAVTLGQFAGRGARPWRVLHVGAGLALGSATALACILSPAFWASWSPGPLVAMVPLLGVAAMLLLEARRRPTRFLWYPALFVVSLSSLWIARWLGATNPQWYVVLTGMTVSALAVRAPRDPVLPAHPLGVCRVCAALGSAVPLGISAYQSLDGDSGIYTLVLAAETCFCLVGGFWFRNRALVAVGAVGAAVLVLRALALVGQLVSPSAAVAAVAIVLVACGITLLTSRTRFAQAAADLSRYWRRCL